jgi:hypothetical protein
MSRPRFLADEDLNVEIIAGLMRVEPALELRTVRAEGLAGRPDAAVLQFAAEHGFVVVSHDSNTMTADASERIRAHLVMPGLAIIHQWIGVGPAIKWLLMVWEATEAEEWFDKIDFAWPED